MSKSKKPEFPPPAAVASGIRPGRPCLPIPADAATRIREYAADGFTVTGIAAKLGIGRRTLYDWFERDETLKEALEQGRAEEERSLAKRLYRTAVEGEGKEAVTAAIFLLKAKHGWREGERTDDGAPRVNITFNLPGALSREEFMKSVVMADERTI
jgi:AcrR family transcriptional regulator